MLFCVFLLGVLSFFAGNHEVSGGNIRPYWVSITGFQGAGSVGQDASANGYAGSSLVSPLSSDGFNSPLARYSPSPYTGNPPGAGFGGFSASHSRSGGHSAPVAGGQGKLPYAGGRK